MERIAVVSAGRRRLGVVRRRCYKWHYSLPTAIVDPYGQPTTLTYDTNGQLTKVTEPGGRYLQFNYSTVNGYTMLTGVDAYDGVPGHSRIDWVVYHYTLV